MQTYKKRTADDLAQRGDGMPENPLSGGMPSLVDGASRKDLPEAIRTKMENAFGADFSNLNIYESEKVAEGGAKAVTQGNTIAFAPGQFNVYSPSSEALLGHELSHVVSQARGESRGNGLLSDSYLEAKADREGVMAAAGKQVYSGPITPLSTSTPMSVAGPMQCKIWPWSKEARERRKAEKEARLEAAKQEAIAEVDSTDKFLSEYEPNYDGKRQNGEYTAFKNAKELLAANEDDMEIWQAKYDEDINAVHAGVKEDIKNANDKKAVKEQIKLYQAYIDRKFDQFDKRCKVESSYNKDTKKVELKKYIHLSKPSSNEDKYIRAKRVHNMRIAEKKNIRNILVENWRNRNAHKNTHIISYGKGDEEAFNENSMISLNKNLMIPPDKKPLKQDAEKQYAQENKKRPNNNSMIPPIKIRYIIEDARNSDILRYVIEDENEPNNNKKQYKTHSIIVNKKDLNKNSLMQAMKTQYIQEDEKEPNKNPLKQAMKTQYIQEDEKKPNRNSMLPAAKLLYGEEEANNMIRNEAYYNALYGSEESDDLYDDGFNNRELNQADSFRVYPKFCVNTKNEE